MTRISSIYHRANADPPTGAEAQRRNHEAYAKAWHQRGLVVLDPDEITDDWIRQAVVSEAIRQYGQRRSEHDS